MVLFHESSSHAVVTLQKLCILQSKGVLCDALLRAGTKEINAHRSILAACSPYFYEVFQQPELVSNCLRTIVNIQGIDGVVLESLVAYCYTGHLKIDSSCVEAMLTAATILQMSEIEGLCRKHLDMNKPVHEIDQYSQTMTEFHVVQPSKDAEAIGGDADESEAADMSAVKSFQCSFCSYSSSRAIDIRSHVKLHAADSGERTKVFVCDQCEYRCSRASQHQLHMKTHLGVKPFSCDLCGLVFSRRFNLMRHKRRAHVAIRHDETAVVDASGVVETRIEPSLQGGSLLPDPTLVLSSGAQLVDCDAGGQVYRCEQCGFETIYIRMLNKHLVSHMPKSLKCAVCKRGYALEALLMEHLKTHADTLPYQCNKCAYQTVKESNLRRHKYRTHFGSLKRFACRVCPARFASRPAFQSHMLLQHAQPLSPTGATSRDAAGTTMNGPLLCVLPGGGSSATDVHLPALLKVFTCSHCGYRAISSYQLRAHISRAHNAYGRESIYVCDMDPANCNFSCLAMTSYKRHLRTRHGIGAKSGAKMACNATRSPSNRREDSSKCKHKSPKTVPNCATVLAVASLPHPDWSDAPLQHASDWSTHDMLAGDWLQQTSVANGHAAVDGSVGEFVCSECGESFGSDLLLMNHLQVMHAV